MGYLTCYDLKIENSNEEKNIEIFNFMKENEQNYYGLWLDKPGDFYDYQEDVKWYDHEEYMKILAAKFPEQTFILHGQGEDPEDEWEKLFEGEKHMWSRYIERVWGKWK